MDRVVYLIGTGATMAEMEHQGIEGRLRMEEIGQAVYEMSKGAGGKYKELHDRFSFSPNIDIEETISLLEGCTYSESGQFKEVCEELRGFCRIHLISQIADKKVKPEISSSLLRIHKEYAPYMGKDGEEITGILTINYDSLMEEACRSVYGGLNCGYPFKSDTYKDDNSLPQLLKLHGSFNWKIKKGRIFRKNALEISKIFEEIEYEDDHSGWMPPSVYKKPTGVFESIWDKAARLLTECNTLRVVGSSLRKTDSALLSLIFTSQIKSRSINGQSFSIELIVSDEDALGSEKNSQAITQRIKFLDRMVNFSKLDVYPKEFISKGNVYKEWLQMKITEIERNKGISLSGDQFLSERLWEV